MASEWFYLTPEGTEVGPMSAADLKRLAMRNRLQSDTPIRRGAGGRWAAAAKFKGLLDAGPTVSPPAPSVRERSNGQNDTAPLLVSNVDRTGHPIASIHDRPVAAGLAARDQTSSQTLGASITEPTRENLSAQRPQISPLILIGASVGGTLLFVFVILIALGGLNNLNSSDANLAAVETSEAAPTIVDGAPSLLLGKGNKPGLDQPHLPPPSPPAVEMENPFEDELQGVSESLLVQAKKLLLGNLIEIKGTPEENVKKAIELLNEYTALPDADDLPEAKLLLEHAQIAISDEAAIRLLRSLDDRERRSLARLPQYEGDNNFDSAKSHEVDPNVETNRPRI